MFAGFLMVLSSFAGWIAWRAIAESSNVIQIKRGALAGGVAAILGYFLFFFFIHNYLLCTERRL